MKLLWLILTLIPAPFLFHFYEYGQHAKREEAPFLLLGSILFVVITGVLGSQVKIWYIVLVNVITVVLSLLLARYLIADDAWFKPIGRDFAILVTAIVFLIGQLLISHFLRTFFRKKG